MSVYKHALSSARMSGGAKNTGYSAGQKLSNTTMPKLSVGKAAGNTTANETGRMGDPMGKSKTK
jgi:hypothetical protein